MRSVYAISDGARAIKIGVAMDVAKRASSLQTGLPRRAVVLASFRVDRAREVERWVHASLAPHHLRGEWFAITKGVAIQRIVQAIAALGIPTYERVCPISGRTLSHLAPSDFVGVSYASPGKFRARFRRRGQKKSLTATFSTVEDAARQYDAWAREHRGAHAAVNFPETSP